MIIGRNRTSAGKFVVTADIVGSFGEVTNAQVGRFHATAQAAINAATHQAAKNGWKNVCVYNPHNQWRFTVVV